MNHLQVWGSLSLLAGIWAVPLLIAFAQTGWGAPGTAVYQTYQLLNQLMIFLTATLLALVIGYNLLRVNRDEPL